MGALAAKGLGVALLLVLVTACGGDSGDSGDAADPEPSPTASAGASAQETAQETPEQAEQTTQETAGSEQPAGAGELSQADLEEVLLTAGDLAEFQFTEVPDGERDAPPTAAEPGECQPVENMRLEALDPAPTAVARRYALATAGDHLGTGTTITLAAYSAQDAEGIVADLRQAVADCAAGYRGGALTFTEVTGTPAVEVGEEAVSFHLAGQGTQPAWYTLVRQGPVLIRFSSSSMSEEGGEVPVPVIVQQVMKLQAAQAR